MKTLGEHRLKHLKIAYREQNLTPYICKCGKKTFQHDRICVICKMDKKVEESA